MPNTLLNTANCGGTSNTGVMGCNNEPGLLKYIVLVPKGTSIPAASLDTQANFNTYVDAAMVNASRSDRWFISPLLGEFKNNTGATVFKEMDGQQIFVQHKPYNWEWRFAPGNKCLHKKWKGFDQQQSNYDCFVVDENGLWMGWEDASNPGVMQSYSLASLTISDWGPRAGTEPNMYSVNLSFSDNRQFNLYWAQFPSTRPIASIGGGLTDVYLSQGLNTAGTAITNTTSYIYVRGTVACAGSLLGDLFGDVLDDTTAWSVTDTAGSAVSLTGVTYSSITKNFRLASSAAFTSAATFNVKLGAVSALIALDPAAKLITETAWSVTIP